MPTQRLFMMMTLGIAAGSAAVQESLHPGGYLPGDCYYYALVTESLLKDGDLDLTNQLLGDGPLESHREKLRVHEGFFAVSTDGRVVPKHSILLPVIALPFAALFGTMGFLVLNVLLTAVLVAGVADLGGASRASRVAALLMFVTSSWLAYCHNFSPDLLVAALVVWSYALVRRERWLLAGLSAGLAVWAKVYAAVILLPLALVVFPVRWSSLIRCTIGAIAGVAPMLILNAALFGSPFITGYDRDGRVEPAGFSVREHYSLFNQPVGTGLLKVLFDANAGMIRTAPLWFLAPLGFAVAWRTRSPFPRRLLLAIALGAAANVLLFAPYEAWNQTIHGNRFLFPAVALGGALLTPLVQRYLPRLA